MASKHHRELLSGDIHTIIEWDVADQAARLALDLTAPSVELLQHALEQCLPVRDVYFRRFLVGPDQTSVLVQQGPPVGRVG